MQIGNLLVSRRLIIVVAMVILVVSSIVGYSYINSDLDYNASISVKAPPKSTAKLYDKIANLSVSDTRQSTYVNSVTGIDFTQSSSDLNGKGIYLYSSTSSDDYPIYYYRGAVEDNHVLFAGFCWKIVRTTDTGGTKLIYNGTPDENGACGTVARTYVKLNGSLYSEYSFNSSYTLPAHVGYMFSYGVGSGISLHPSKNNVYGASFTYENGNYTLVDTVVGAPDNTHHYYCRNETGICSQLYYIINYDVEEPSVKHVFAENIGGVDELIDLMQTNSSDSSIKTRIDSWFNDTFKTYFTTNNKDYNDYLEDTVWCNDRSMNTLGSSEFVNNAWIPNGGVLNSYLYFSPYGRMITGQPTVLCSQKNDSFTVEESEIGNGALTYPVGLLTSDEVILAGGSEGENTSYYLYTNYRYHTMSPYMFTGTEAMTFVVNNGQLSDYKVSNSIYLRPSISLKNDILIKSGNGESTTPYVIE